MHFDKFWRERMGGYGSGGGNRKYSGTVEGCRRLNAMILQRRGLLMDGTAGSTSWSSNGENMGSIGIRGGRNQVVLHYRTRRGDEAWSDVEQAIGIDWFPRPFGGEQPFLLCPKCGRRACELCMGARHFACARCTRVVHASTRERASDRARRRAMKLRRRLGGSAEFEGPIIRPKRMRHDRFQRTMDEIIQKEAESWDDAIRLLDRLRRMEPHMSRPRQASPSSTQSAGRFW